MGAVILVPAGGISVKLSRIAVGRAVLWDCPGGRGLGLGFGLSPLEQLYYSIGEHVLEWE